MTLLGILSRICLAEAELMSAEKSARAEHLRHWVAEARQTLAGLRATLGVEGVTEEKEEPKPAKGRNGAKLPC